MSNLFLAAKALRRSDLFIDPWRLKKHPPNRGVALEDCPVLRRYQFD
jgi:hypothetical protein